MNHRDSADLSNHIHWKKALQVRFEIESNIAEVVKACTRGDLNEAGLSIVRNWRNDYDFLGNKLGARSNNNGRRLLNQHKTLVHLSEQYEKINGKEFCYLPYFAEHGQFEKVTRRREHQVDCSLCQKWLGGVRNDVKINSEELKTKIETGVVKKRGRKSRSKTRRACELCSKILSNRKGLERHMLIHTGEKPFACDVCGKPFRRKDNCVRHKKTAHLFKKPRKPRRRRGIDMISQL